MESLNWVVRRVLKRERERQRLIGTLAGPELVHGRRSWVHESQAEC